MPDESPRSVDTTMDVLVTLLVPIDNGPGFGIQFRKISVELNGLTAYIRSAAP